MALSGNRTFVGFGFGAIQAGLFLYEAFRSGNFRRLVVAEVMPNAVDALRQAHGIYTVNVAYLDRVEAECIGPIETLNPQDPRDRELLIAAIAEADEIATALPSVKFFTADAPSSVHRILAEGLQRKCKAGGPPAVLYAAENHNHAAEILESAVMSAVEPASANLVKHKIAFLNTVIGKMSGVITDAGEIAARHLVAVTPTEQRAFLVESFNRILISRIPGADRFDGEFARGIQVFEEKPDLLPFEEAKLYGHNSTHALAAYLGQFLGLQRIAELRSAIGIPAFLEAAFIHESGAALTQKRAGVDALFTPEGYKTYADDLLVRMFNPYLGDTVERVGRDPLRKLEWDDRLIGTIRVALQQSIEPRHYSVGAAAATAALDAQIFNAERPLDPVFDSIWSHSNPDRAERQRVLQAIEQGRVTLKRWRVAGYPNLEQFLTQPSS